MERGYSYDTYSTISLVLPIMLLLTAPTEVFAVLLFLLLYCRRDKKYFWIVSFKTLRQVYGDELQKNEGGEFTLYGRPLYKCSVVTLLCAVLVIFTCVLVSFWSELVVDQSDVCSISKDCFAFHPNEGLPIQTEPLSFQNCTSFQSEEFIIECFIFSFNYIDAIGNCGSVLIVGTFIMRGLAGLFAGMLTLKDKFKCFGRCIVWIFIVVQVTFGVLLLLLILYLLMLPVVDQNVTDTNNSTIQFSAYYGTLLFSYVAIVSALMFNCQCRTRCSSCSRQPDLEESGDEMIETV